MSKLKRMTCFLMCVRVGVPHIPHALCNTSRPLGYAGYGRIHSKLTFVYYPKVCQRITALSFVCWINLSSLFVIAYDLSFATLDATVSHVLLFNAQSWNKLRHR